jgi:hypothetical protein
MRLGLAIRHLAGRRIARADRFEQGNLTVATNQ